MNKHLHFEKNLHGIDYVVGDIHGCYTTFMNALDAIGFDESKDRMFSVGDIVDRGAHSMMCLDLLKKPYFHCILGNHEQMAIDYIDSLGDFEARHYYKTYSANGGDWFLDCHLDLQKIIVDKFRELPIVITVDDVALVHADPVYTVFENLIRDLDADTKLAEYVKQNAIWNRGYVYSETDVIIQGVSRIFLGHTPMKGKPKQISNMLYIDTGCVFGHTLTIYKLDGSFYHQEQCVDKRYESKYFR